MSVSVYKIRNLQELTVEDHGHNLELVCEGVNRSKRALAANIWFQARRHVVPGQEREQSVPMLHCLT
jgi:hypothetical protein